MSINWAILKITNGTQTVDLLGLDGISLNNWQPNIADYKGGGIVQESPLSEGSGYSFGRYANVVETMTFHVRGVSQDQTIRATQKLRELLAQSFSYSATRWQSNPVWLEAKAANETNTRYAVIVSARMPQDGYQYGQPFFPLNGQPAMINLSVQIERQHWLSKKPGEYDAVTGLTAYQFWGAAFNFTQVTAAAVPDLPAPAGRYYVETVEDDIILAFDDTAGNIYRSADRGLVWALVHSTVSIQDVLKITDNYIIASDSGSGGRLIYSTDKGTTWSVLSSAVGGGRLGILQNNDHLITNVSSAIHTSSDQGATWTGSIGTLPYTPSSGAVEGFFYKSSTNTIYIGEDTASASSTDAGVTWVAGKLSHFVGVNSQGKVLTRTFDNTSITYIGQGDIVYLAGTILGGANPTSLSRSFDDMENEVTAQSLVNGYYANNITQNDSGDIFIGGDSVYIQEDTYDHPYIFGGSSDLNQVNIGNKHASGQITHMLQSDDDGATFGTNIWPIRAATTLHTFAASGDSLYFGSDTSVDGAGPFCSLQFNISTAVTLLTVTYQYWNGSAWAGLTVTDNTSSFNNAGANSVHWVQPTDWATVALGGVTGFWVRAKRGGNSGSPVQDAEDIFTINTPFVEIPQAQVGGDIPALAFVRLVNRSSTDAGSMHSNRALCGLRSTSRGIKFRSFFNLGDTATDGDLSNAIGVTVADDQAVTGAASQTGNGYKLTYTPGAAESLVTGATISIATTVADEYTGTYRAFIRCHQTAGSVGDAELAIGIRANSGDVLTTTETKSVPTLDDWQLVDLGQVQIHSDNHIPGVEVGDQAQIVIKCGSNSASTVLDIYDLILMPVDEWSGDFQDRANTSSSRVDNGQFLDIDSVQYPKTRIRSFARTSTGVTKANYAGITNGAAILQTNTTQRLWFLFARYGTSGDWVSEPWVTHGVEVNKVQRYLSARGNY